MPSWRSPPPVTPPRDVLSTTNVTGEPLGIRTSPVVFTTSPAISPENVRPTAPLSAAIGSFVRTWRLVPAGIIFKRVVAAVVVGVATRDRDIPFSAQATRVRIHTVVRHTIAIFFISTPPVAWVQSGGQVVGGSGFLEFACDAAHGRAGADAQGLHAHPIHQAGNDGDFALDEAVITDPGYFAGRHHAHGARFHQANTFQMVAALAIRCGGARADRRHCDPGAAQLFRD